MTGAGNEGLRRIVLGTRHQVSRGAPCHRTLRLDRLEAALKGGENGKVITPGKSRDSALVIAVAQLDEETAMPPKKGPGGPGERGPAPKPLTATEVGLVRAGIDQGAK